MDGHSLPQGCDRVASPEGSELSAEAKPDLGLAKIKAVVFDHGNPDRDLVRRGRFSRQS